MNTVGRHPYNTWEKWDDVIRRIALPLDCIYKALPCRDSLKLFLPYIITHDANGHWARLVDPEKVGYQPVDWWPQAFVEDNREELQLAITKGRERDSTGAKLPYLYQAIKAFEDNDQRLFAIDPPSVQWADMKTSDFEWKDDNQSLDDLYPMLIKLKVKVEGIRNPCIAVISASYDSQEPAVDCNLTELRECVRSVSEKLFMPIADVTYHMETWNWADWNRFRRCYKDNQKYKTHNLHHAVEGNIARPFSGGNDIQLLQKLLRDEVVLLLKGNGYCNTHDDYFSIHGNEPSVVELLIWDNTHNSCAPMFRLLSDQRYFGCQTALLNDSLIHGYWWINPYVLNKLVMAVQKAYLSLTSVEMNLDNSGVVSMMLQEHTNPDGLSISFCEPGLAITELRPLKFTNEDRIVKPSGNLGEVLYFAQILGSRKGTLTSESMEWTIDIPVSNWAGSEQFTQQAQKCNSEFGGIVFFVPSQPCNDGRLNGRSPSWEILDPTSQGASNA